MASARIIFTKIKEKFVGVTSNTPESADNAYAPVMKIINMVSYPLGIEMKKDWTMSVRGMMNLIINLFLFWTEIYSLYELKVSVLGLITLAGMSFTLNAVAKLAVFWCNHKKFYSLFEFIFKVYEQNSSGNGKIILSDTTVTTFYHFKLVVIGTFSAFSLFVSYPIYDLVFNGHLTKVSPLVLPHVDDTTVGGYFTLFGLQFLCTGLNILGGISVDFIFLACVDVCGGMVTLVEDDLRVFDVMWEKKHHNKGEREALFRNIMIKLMDIARYVACMSKLFSFISTVQIGICYLMTATVIFGYLAIDYISGIGCTVYFITELMIFCYIGQLIENTTKRLQIVIYNTKWYLYDLKYQRDMMIALQIAQGLKPVMVANIRPLNFQTGLMVMNNIYTMTMFFIKFLE